MKKICCLVLFITVCIAGKASTSITTSSVFGHWTLAGSPYLIFNNIEIVNDTSLVIDPGVEVVFQGSYYLGVYGVLKAAGTAAMPINFHVSDTTGWSTATPGAGGWQGIFFGSYTGAVADTSAFQYCNVFDEKDNVCNFTRPFVVQYCNFYHNKSGAIGISPDPVLDVEISNCQFYNNSGQITISLGSVTTATGRIHLHSNKIFQNTAEVGVIHAGYANMLVDSNEIYQNSQTDTANGSIIEMYNCLAVIRNNKVYENTTMFDGAISCWSTISDINANYICNNQVMVGYTTSTCGHLQGGGGIRIDDEGDTLSSSNTIRNNIIANNYTAYYGAGVYVIGANADIINNDIINNNADQGGIFLYSDAAHVVKIKNNILFDNVSTNASSSGPADTMNVHIGTGDSVLYENNWTQHSFTGDVYNGAALAYPGDTMTNIIGMSPQLTAPTLTASALESALTADFTQLSTSPTINAGSIAGIIPGYTDYAGNFRVSGGIIDIGAYEYGATTFPLITKTIAAKTISVYPNPADNIVSIATPEPSGFVVMQDISGNIVVEKNVLGSLTSLDLHSIPRGVYFLAWSNEGVKTVQKVVVQ